MKTSVSAKEPAKLNPFAEFDVFSAQEFVVAGGGGTLALGAGGGGESSEYGDPVVSITTFIPSPQWPIAPQTKYAFPNSVSTIVALAPVL